MRMWWPVLLLLTLALLVFLVGAGKVKELTDANFQAETEGEGGYFKTDDVWLVSFSAVWDLTFASLQHLLRPLTIPNISLHFSSLLFSSLHFTSLHFTLPSFL